MLLSLLLLAIPAAILWMIYRSRTSRLARLGNLFPGPKPLPFLGNTFELGSNPAEFLANMNRICMEYGSPARFWVGSKLFFFASDPDTCEVIMSNSKYNNKSQDYEFIKPWLGTGLLTSEGEKWKRHRKIITPTFHFKILQQFVEVFNTQGDILIEKLKKEMNGPEFDVHEYVDLMTLDVISETAMGVNLNTQQNSSVTKDYVEALRVFSHTFVLRMFRPWLRNPYIFPLTPTGRQQAKAIKVLHSLTGDIIARRKKDMENGLIDYPSDDAAEDGVGQKRRLAFLDLLLLSSGDGAQLSDTEVREEVDTFMFAGHDTTSTAISMALWLLARHPEVQDKVVEELDSIFMGSHKSATFHDLQNMHYLECVLKECERTLPSVPMIGRELPEDAVVNGRVIPAGSSVMFAMFPLHKNPKYFPEPEKFNPDRFLSGDMPHKDHPYAFLPFSAGPRNCVGQRFAGLEVRAVISKVLRHYRLLPGEQKEMVLSLEMTLKSKNGVMIKLAPR